MKHGRTHNEAGDYCPQCLVHISRKVTGWTWLAVWLETEMPNQTKLVFNVLTFFVFICLHFLHNSRVYFKVWVIWKQSQCHQVYDLAKIDFHYECISFLVNNLHTFCHWKVVFSLILILHRAFSHFMYLTFCQFCKRKMVQSSFQKLFLNLDCDVVSNLVVEIEISDGRMGRVKSSHAVFSYFPLLEIVSHPGRLSTESGERIFTNVYCMWFLHIKVCVFFQNTSLL